MKISLREYRVKPGTSVKLKNFDPANTDGFKTEEAAREQMATDLQELVTLQEKLFASDRYSVLVILQAMDAAGKDGVIKHVMSGLNPQGCKVTSFKHPSDEDYDHDFFWRINKALPERGQIGIFNRSHYENVLICRVHPELVLQEKLPQYDTVKKLDKKFWEHRFHQINRFEKNLVQNGTIILKFFLHISPEEQKQRLLKRIENPDKHWKFNFSDITERDYWKPYMKCYEEAIAGTSTDDAPWYIIPADNKWYTRAVIAHTLTRHLKKLDLQYPVLDKEEAAKLEKAKTQLIQSNS